jgi:hypothetical protein
MAKSYETLFRDQMKDKDNRIRQLEKEIIEKGVHLERTNTEIHKLCD